MSGLDPRQVLEQIVRPALRKFPPGFSTPAAEQLVMGTAAQESGLRYLKQVGAGPALGIWQVEPSTARWLRDGFLSGRSELRAAVHAFASRPTPEPEELVWNLRLAAAYCRLRYIASPRPLPRFGDTLALAEEWKQTYNSALGKGTPDQFLQSWERIIAPARLWP